MELRRTTGSGRNSRCSAAGFCERSSTVEFLYLIIVGDSLNASSRLLPVCLQLQLVRHFCSRAREKKRRSSDSARNLREPSGNGRRNSRQFRSRKTCASTCGG